PIPADSSSSTSTLTSCPFKSQGDANCDRIINISDFNIWRDEALIKTSSTTRADFNNDSVVDSTDLSIWIQSMRDKLRYIPAED
ncbi:MAG: hypothetical protein Q8O68_01365, partial [Candidatus Daviesbacteria bacterium]|nr:hypothetical protein [Candidatus Daviesbacteria bacterium]